MSFSLRKIYISVLRVRSRYTATLKGTYLTTDSHAYPGRTPMMTLLIEPPLRMRVCASTVREVFREQSVERGTNRFCAFWRAFYLELLDCGFLSSASISFLIPRVTVVSEASETFCYQFLRHQAGENQVFYNMDEPLQNIIWWVSSWVLARITLPRSSIEYEAGSFDCLFRTVKCMENKLQYILVTATQTS